ncbi:DNA polymerase III subunit delta' [Aurantimonas sp. VKM B-3413]|uniref:DNA polymerase III subunit delta' n=1 Tax=Aurantimonas sp. VKM B-3413 TaxID=2779401 RepID=UPI001E645419|nr:DNA polymerase III subunit delta' [Aurantimonas sp. VKM B-3413]
MSSLWQDVPAGHDDLDQVAPPPGTLSLFGHERAWHALEDARTSGRLHHAWLLQGPRGIGKATAAFAFARVLAGAEKLEPAGEATARFRDDDPVVRQIAIGTLPGLIHVMRPPVERGSGFRTQITVEEVRKLNRFFHATGSSSGWRIAIIDPADDLNRSAANALLKMLEEPPGRSVFLIANHTPGRILPTIRSRCRLLRFEPLGETDLKRAVSSAAPSVQAAEIDAALRLCEGSVRQALMLIANGGTEINRTLAGLIEASEPDWTAIQTMADALTQKGREAAYDLLVTAFLGALAAASEKRLKAGDGDGAAELARLWQEETRRISEAAAYNLDRKQTVLTMFDRYFTRRRTIAAE